MEWQAYFEDETNDHQPLYFYLAQIALEVRRSFARNPGRFRLRDFLISFQKKTTTTLQPTSIEDRKKHVAKSKSAWLGWLGIGRKK